MIHLALTTVEFSAWFGVAATVIGIVVTYVRALAKINEVEAHVKEIAAIHSPCRAMQDQRHEDIRDGFADLRERMARIETLMTTVIARLDGIASGSGNGGGGKRRGGRSA